MPTPFFADTHTHTLHSHDSPQPLDGLCEAAVEKGIAAVTVTDHLDIEFAEREDVLAPILDSVNDAKRAAEKYAGRLTVLHGVEMGEAVWYPETAKKACAMTDYDEIVGSVHAVRFEGLSGPFIDVDFASLPDETIRAFLDAYFRDVYETAVTFDYDVQAHLTVPLRYIVGRAHRTVDLRDYDEIIDAIIETVIRKDRALEINTGYADIFDYAPPFSLVKRYYERGGRLVTLASDAHVAKNVGKLFGEAASALKEIGFAEACYFKGRKPVLYAI